MSLLIGVLLIIIPFLVGIVLLIYFKFKADTVGTIVFVLMLILALTYFKTDWRVTILASLAGMIKSFPISLMVLTSILMMSYMEKTVALKKIVVSFKKIGGGNQAFQIMLINLAFGTFLVSIGATPVTMLPPVLAAMGYSAFVSVALPAIGYDPLCTYALLAVPAVFFADFMEIPLQTAGLMFSYYMPLVTLGISLGMLWLAGGSKLLFSKDGLIFGFAAGLTAGSTAILSNYLNIVTLTGVLSGIVTAIVLIVIAWLKKIKIIDSSVLTPEEKKIDEGMSLWRALTPWIFLIVFVAITNLITPIFDFLHNQLPFTITIGEIAVNTAFLSQAYFWMLIATICSIPFLGWETKKLSETTKVWLKRSIRPVYAAAIYFGIAFIMIYSGTIISATGWENVVENNMNNVLATATAQAFGNFYPLIAPFIGLLGGFVSGSETSAIAMFTNFHKQTAINLGINAIVVGTANGIGGGLASVISPAKIQNAAAVIDQIGIEGEVLRKTAPIAILMTLSVAAVSLCWASSYVWWLWLIVMCSYFLIMGITGFMLYKKK